MADGYTTMMLPRFHLLLNQTLSSLVNLTTFTSFSYVFVHAPFILCWIVKRLIEIGNDFDWKKRQKKNLEGGEDIIIIIFTKECML